MTFDRNAIFISDFNSTHGTYVTCVPRPCLYIRSACTGAEGARTKNV